MSARTTQFSRESDLTGLWSGEYWHAGDPVPTVPFSAHLVDMAGSITGSTLEPNTFAHPGLFELSADLTGARGELSVRFTKLYHAAPGVRRDPVFHTGTVDPNFTVIDGQWLLEPQGEPLTTGRFVLVRVSRGAARAAVERQTEAELKS